MTSRPSATELVAIDLTPEERDLLSHGLLHWGGPAHCTEEMAVALGFLSVADLLAETKRLSGALAASQPLALLDWMKALIAVEVVFVSNVVGAGTDWSIVTPFPDDETIRALRSIQRKFRTTGAYSLVGNGFGTRPAMKRDVSQNVPEVRVRRALRLRPALPFRVVRPDTEKPPFLELPSIIPDREITLHFDDNEFTVTFSTWHTHFDDLKEALELVDALAADQQVVFAAYVDDTWRESQVSEPSDDAWLDFVTSTWPRDPPNRFRLISWSGAVDKEIKA